MVGKPIVMIKNKYLNKILEVLYKQQEIYEKKMEKIN